MMNKTFFESIYKEALKSNLQEGNLNEMAQAYAPQIRQFCAIHPEFAFLYKNPAHTASGTPAKAKYDALVDEFYEMFPDMANTDRLDRNGNVKHQGKGTAIANAFQPIADKIIKEWKEAHPGEPVPTGLDDDTPTTTAATPKAEAPLSDEAKANKVISLLRQAQLIVDELGKGDTNLANILMSAQDAVADDLLVVPAPESTPAASAEEPVAEPAHEEASTTSDDPFDIFNDKDFLGGEESAPASSTEEPVAEPTHEEPEASSIEQDIDFDKPANEEPKAEKSSASFDDLDFDNLDNLSDEDFAEKFGF